MAGAFCPKHQQWWPDGECRWCAGLREEREAKAKQKELEKYPLMMLDTLPPPLVPGAAPIPALATGRGLRPCACGLFQCVDQQAGWIDFATGMVHTPAGCGRP